MGEKLIGALRAGVKTVLLPAQNKKDAKDLPQEVKDGLEIIHVRHIWEAMQRLAWCPLARRAELRWYREPTVVHLSSDSSHSFLLFCTINPPLFHWFRVFALFMSEKVFAAQRREGGGRKGV